MTHCKYDCDYLVIVFLEAEWFPDDNALNRIGEELPMLRLWLN